ncbi:MAG: hypothetical protein NZ853_00815 [Leptospiraceae bacterium]|nr:hypothetical protein [Leptospiraceae bacterium]MDW7976230.1 hypothetical protein [Leptospiraceae bacterium]
MKWLIRTFNQILLILLLKTSIIPSEFNTLNLNSIDHWNIRISDISWESATIRNAFQISYIKLFDNLLKGKVNLSLYTLPTTIKASGFQLSTPECSENQCSDFYIQIHTSGSRQIFGLETVVETFQNNFGNISVILTNSKVGFYPSYNQTLNNVSFGYHNDFFLFQENPYLKNIGFRIGLGLDSSQYGYTARGLDTSVVSLIQITNTNPPTINASTPILTNSFLEQKLDYTESFLKLRVGINYLLEILGSHQFFFNIDPYIGYGAVSYKRVDRTRNLEIFNLLNNPNVNFFTISFLLPRSRLTDGPALLEVPGYEASFSYGYKINPKHIVRAVYRYKQETHKLKAPKIEPEENINLTGLLFGDITPILLSELKILSFLPKNKDVVSEVGIEYSFQF